MLRKATFLVLAILVLLPVMSGMPDAAAFGYGSIVSAGSGHTMFIDANGVLWAWGDNSQGQLGDGTLISRREPVRIMDRVTMVSAGDRYNLAMRDDGSLWAWGQNDRGQLGDGTIINRRTPVRIMEDVIYAAAGWKRTDGGLGAGGAARLWVHSVAITSDGSLWAWGDNNAGQLGDGTLVNKRSPVRVMEDVTAVSAGDMFTMVIRGDGSLWAWGQNDRGQFGNDTYTNSRHPVRIMENVASVYAGDSYTMVILDDGTLLAMGQNDRGQFGNGNRISRRIPVQLKENVVSIAASGNHTMAIMADGSLWAWGQNNQGQFGNGDRINSSTPVRVMSDVVAVAAGDDHTVAISADGILWAWGFNNRGQLGDGTTVNRLSPVPIKENVLTSEPPVTRPPELPPAGEEITVILDGQTLTFDMPPMTIDGRTLVPMRAIFTAMGARVDWNMQTLTARAERGDVVVFVQEGSDLLVRNGENITLDVPAVNIDSRTLVPARAIAESFGAQVTWDPVSRTVTIVS